MSPRDITAFAFLVKHPFPELMALLMRLSIWKSGLEARLTFVAHERHLEARPERRAGDISATDADGLIQSHSGRPLLRCKPLMR